VLVAPSPSKQIRGSFPTMALVSDAAPSRKGLSATLPLIRYEDLRAAGIVKTWHTLNNWIDTRGFPPGRMIGRFRTWTVAEVMAWVESQPTDKIEPRGAAKALASNGRGESHGRT
jgi:hypothetical protein